MHLEHQKHFDANMNVISMSSVELELKAPEPLPEARSIGILECD